MDPSKVEDVLSWPLPTNLRELRGFLGLNSYYRKFIWWYAPIARPLTDQLKIDAFGWIGKANEAFENLKTAVTQAPILALPDFSKRFVVETDASRIRLGAVLMQDQYPVVYFSKAFGTRAQLKPIYEGELMAIVFAILKWRHYLLGRKFVVKTKQPQIHVGTKGDWHGVPKVGYKDDGVRF